MPSNSNAARPRVLLIGPVPPPMGGIVRYAEDIMGSWLAERYRIVRFNDNIPERLRPQVRTSANTWNIFRRDGVMPTVRVFNHVGKLMVQLDRLMTRERFDVVHILSTAGFGFFRNTVHARIARHHGAATIMHLLGQIDDLHRDSPPWLQKLVKVALNSADIHVTQSAGLCRYVQNITKRPVRFIINGVRTDELRPPRGHAQSGNGLVEIITLGYLGAQKGTLEILEAAGRLRDSHPQVRFTFIGGGEVEKFRQLAAEKGLAERVRFVGVLDDLERTRRLHASDIFLLPSRAEGQPIALLEAMAAGLPVITTRVGSIPELVMPENGVLLNPKDPIALTAAIRELATDLTKRVQMGRTNAMGAERDFRLGRVFDQLSDLYLEAASAERAW